MSLIRGLISHVSLWAHSFFLKFFRLAEVVAPIALSEMLLGVILSSFPFFMTTGVMSHYFGGLGFPPPDQPTFSVSNGDKCDATPIATYFIHFINGTHTQSNEFR